MKDNLGNRMKNNYENRAKTQLLRRTPVIIRLDGEVNYYVNKQGDAHIVGIGNINFFTTQVDL